jgi:DNA-binding response OmpR family regulator
MLLATVSHTDPHRTPVLLIVEDHEDTRLMYAEFLAPDFEVIQAEDGEQALDAMRTRRPDVVITDLSLPRVDGFELVARMRGDAELRSIPIICLSGYGGQGHDVRALEAGCNRMLQKPCMPDALAAVALELIREHQPGGMSR